MSDFKGLLRRHKAWFGEVASNTRNIRSVYSFETPQSIFDVNVVGDNMFSKLSEAKELERPAQKNDDEKKTDLKDDSRFAKLNINDCTKAVSEIFNFPFVAPIDEDQEAALRLAPTFFVNPFVDVRKLSDISKPMVPVPRFLPVNESFLRTKTYLHIASIHATVRGRYTAKEPGELNLEDKERLTQVQKVNEYWYWGTKDPPGTSETSTLDGLFERSWVLFGLGLYMPLKVRAKTASKRDESISCALCFEKGEELEIMRINHGVLWFGRTSFTKPNMQLGFFKVSDIELDASTQPHVDALLSFFSFPYPDFLGASGAELKKRILVFIQLHTYQPRTLQRMYAHCRSFTDLQLLQRAIEDYCLLLEEPRKPTIFMYWESDWEKTGGA